MKEKHKLNQENAPDFVNELQSLFAKYNLHESGKVQLKASNINFTAELLNCRPECRHFVEQCDIKGKNCQIVMKCDC
jgi:hypothetical protein